MVDSGALDFDAALSAGEVDTILFTIGVMVISAYFDSSEFLEATERTNLRPATSARGQLWWVVLMAGALSAILKNDTICLNGHSAPGALGAPFGLPFVPNLMTLAAAAEIGDTRNFLGTPQNAAIASASGIPLPKPAAIPAPLSTIGLALLGVLMSWRHRRQVSRVPIALPT